jgi:hypothetical protein
MEIDVGIQTTEMAGTAAVTGTFAVLATIKGVALELLGVPLPVVLAAATAAFAARSFLPPTTYPKALCGGIVWTLIGVFLSSLVLSIVAAWTGQEPASAALAGVALLIAGLGPLLWPVVKEKCPQVAGRWMDRLGGKNGSSDS